MASFNRLEWLLQQVHGGRSATVRFSFNPATNIEKVMFILEPWDGAQRSVFRPVVMGALSSLHMAMIDSVVTDKGHSHKGTAGKSIIEFWVKPVVHGGGLSSKADGNSHAQGVVSSASCKPMESMSDGAVDVLPSSHDFSLCPQPDGLMSDGAADAALNLGDEMSGGVLDDRCSGASSSVPSTQQIVSMMSLAAQASALGSVDQIGNVIQKIDSLVAGLKEQEEIIKSMSESMSSTEPLAGMIERVLQDARALSAACQSSNWTEAFGDDSPLAQRTDCLVSKLETSLHQLPRNIRTLEFSDLATKVSSDVEQFIDERDSMICDINAALQDKKVSQSS